MLRWSVDYCLIIGAPLVSLDGEVGAWRKAPPEGVVNVHISQGDSRHTLRGMDNYWIHEESRTYGMFNDEGSEGYEGVMSVAWSWESQDQHVPLEDTTPPQGVHIIRGVMLPDEYAKELGLL